DRCQRLAPVIGDSRQRLFPVPGIGDFRHSSSTLGLLPAGTDFRFEGLPPPLISRRPLRGLLLGVRISCYG
ncbi:hypothetical protein LINPERPRIM_LOCUS5428, partial [Linum perenne]